MKNSTPHIAILNGPNLNLLGRREPEIYGTQRFEDYFESLRAWFPDIVLTCFQSNHEGAIIDELQRIGFSVDGIVLNAGAYTHTSIAIADAIGAISAPVIEVHISNVYGREAYRHHSFLSPKCKGVIAGLGLEGYRFAVAHLSRCL